MRRRETESKKQPKPRLGLRSDMARRGLPPRAFITTSTESTVPATGKIASQQNP
jgi:hypothetical protein